MRRFLGQSLGQIASFAVFLVSWILAGLGVIVAVKATTRDDSSVQNFLGTERGAAVLIFATFPFGSMVSATMHNLWHRMKGT